MVFWGLQILNGLAFGSLLFLLGVGLTLSFGVMRIVNLSHASYYLVAAYVTLSIVKRFASFPMALAAAAVLITGLGWVMYQFFLRRMLGRTTSQVLLTMGFLLIFQDLCLWLWGGDPQLVPVPAALQGVFAAGPLFFPMYRLFLIVFGLVMAILLWLALERTRIGAMVRASVDDPEIARAHGIPVPRVAVGVFAFGALLASVAGVFGGPFLGVYPGADLELLPLAFAVVIIGGLGSLPGALLGAILVGVADNLGKALFPELSYFTLFLPMALVLALRPRGLLGRVN